MLESGLWSRFILLGLGLFQPTLQPWFECILFTNKNNLFQCRVELNFNQASWLCVMSLKPVLPHKTGDNACSKTTGENAMTGARVDTGGLQSSTLALPKGCKPLAHQVAGHRYGQGRLGIGMLQHMDGSILKPVQPPPRGQCEVSFYQKVFDPKCEDPVLLTLQPFLAKFLGMWNAPSPFTDMYMKLEDACRRFRNPSILDIKIGRVSYDPDADEEKRSIETAKYPPLQDLGFQLLGMRISGPSANEAIFYDKKYGRSLTKERIFEGFNLFFSGNEAWKKYIVKAFVQRLEMILGWFESQDRYQFYSSSLLLIYEGEFVDGSSDSDEEFIHKYRQMQHPTAPSAASYLATVRKFLNKNNGEEEAASRNKQEASRPSDASKTTEGESKKNNPPSSKEDKATTAASANTSNSSSKKVVADERVKVLMQRVQGNEQLSTEAATDPVDSGNPQVQGERADPGIAPVAPNVAPSTGIESGYSSEAENRLSSRRASERLQREFVTSLNRRIQESARDYVKYRFPPEIVDVKMIDFAHVFEEPRCDDSYIFGLRNLIAYLRQILKTC